MGCGCGGTKKATQWQYVDANGNVTNTRSQIEARAAQIRAGGSGEVREVPK